MIRKILLLIGCALALVLLSVSCTSQFSKDRALVSAYLSALDKIDNTLNQTVGNVLASTDASDPVAISNAVNQYISAAQAAIKDLPNVNMPPIAEVQAQFDAYKNALQNRLDALQQIKGTMVHGDEAGYPQAYSQFVEAGKQLSAAYRLTESLLKKYDLADTAVAYQSRGK